MLTETTTNISEALCNKVRVLTTDQLATHWFSDLKRPKESARRALKKLTAEGMARTTRAMVTCLPVTPLLCWRPTTTEMPDFGSLAARNQKRWQQPPTATTIVVATPKANGLFGGSPRQLRSREVEHDCRVADVWLSLSIEFRKQWILEDSLSPEAFGCRRPDAVITSNNDVRIIDVVGRGYSQNKLEALWQHFRQFNLELR